jgi:hypothetical protein
VSNPMPNTPEQDIRAFRTMVSQLVEWHSPLPKDKHEKLVSDIMLHVPKLLTASNREARIDELKELIDHTGGEPAVSSYVKSRIAELKRLRGGENG